MADTAAAASAPRLWQNRDFALLASGQVISSVGTAVTTFVLPLVTYGLTSSAASVGLVAAATAAAGVLASVPGGVLVDRLDRRKILIAGSACGGLLSAAVAALSLAGGLTLAALVAAGVLAGSVAAVLSAAESAVTRSMVSSQLLGSAVAVRLARRQAAGIAGPPLGGLLLMAGQAVPFLADAGSFCAAAIAALVIRSDLRPPRTGERGFLRQVRAGLSWIWRRPPIRAILVNATLINFALSGMEIVLVVSLRQRGYAPAEIGLLGTVTATAGLLGAMASGAVIRRVPTGRLAVTLSWALAAVSVSLAAVSRLIPVLVIMAAVVVLIPITNAGVTGYQMAATPSGLQGRIAAASGFLAGGAAPLGPAAGTLVLGHAGRAAAFVMFAAVLTAAALSLSVSAQIRTIPLPDAWKSDPGR